jgi:hypothetical protein
MVNSFLQFGGALPFSSFLLKGGAKPKKKTGYKSKRRVAKNKRTNRRTSKKLQKKQTRAKLKKTSLRTSRRTDRRKARRTSRRKARRTSRKTSRKSRIVKSSLSECNCDNSALYRLDELSPEGLGYCSHCTPENITMKGRDGNLWQNRMFDKKLQWVKVRDDMMGGHCGKGCPKQRGGYMRVV